MSNRVMWRALCSQGVRIGRALGCLAAASLASGLSVACSGAGGSSSGDAYVGGGPPQYSGNLQGMSPGGQAAPSGTPPPGDGFFEDDSPRVPTNDGCGSNLTGVLRDFQENHPDFGDAVADDRGLVQPLLGADRKPVYAPSGTTVTTSGAANFNQWYRDTPGINQSREFTLPFVDAGNGIFTYDDPEFFPLDNEFFGNEYQEHNFHFTFELHTDFAYHGGEVFTFAGDDDLFIFINNQLAIDLGGVHSTQTDSVDLDAEAQALGLAVGGTYTLDLFQAERHASGSHFRVDTSLRFTTCGTIILR